MMIALGFEKTGRAVKPYAGSRAFLIALFSVFNFLFLLIFFSAYLQGYQKLLWRRLPELNLDSGSVFIMGTIPAAILFTVVIILWDRRQEQKTPRIWKEYPFFLLVIIAGFLLSMLIVSSLAYHKLVFPIPEAAVNYRKFEAALLVQMKHDSVHFTRTYPHGTNLIELINFIGYVVLVFSGLLMALNRIGRRLAAAQSELLAIALFAPILVGVMFGQSVARSKDWGSEVSLWKSTVRENPRSFAGWNNLGRAYVDRKKFDDAIHCFIMAHSVQPYSLEPILNLGNVMAMFNRIDDAAHYYQWALLINPYSFLARLNLGNCFASQDNYNHAIEQYTIALQIKPDAFEADYGLAYAFYTLGDRPKAFLYAQKALAVAPSHQPSRILVQKLMSENPEH